MTTRQRTTGQAEHRLQDYGTTDYGPQDNHPRHPRNPRLKAIARVKNQIHVFYGLNRLSSNCREPDLIVSGVLLIGELVFRVSRPFAALQRLFAGCKDSM